MLNISENRISEQIKTSRYNSFSEVLNPKLALSLAAWLIGFLLLTVLIMFLPWTQNINAQGALTTLKPSQRPQTIESTVAGRIENWFVNEGDTIEKGDTIVYLSEIKDDYFDPNLLDRTKDQINAKKGASIAYSQKAKALNSQIQALKNTLALKITELENKVSQSGFKVQADSIDLIAAKVADSIASIQFDRWQKLFEQDLKSRTDLEKKRKERQEIQAKLIVHENKLAQSRIALKNAKINLNNIRNEYQEKMAKAESDRQSALSSQFDTEAQVSKMENQYSNYQQRTNFRYIIAPQDGFVNKALKPGIGETVKEGEGIVSIVPLNIQLAAEIYIRPVDLPLAKKGQNVRLEFDGWPAIIFGSGWPGASFGTFGGKVYAVENNISANGLYRILIEEDDSQEQWPEFLRVGSGVKAFALLNDVPVWYELWRQLNGFPPEYYLGPNYQKADKDSSKDKGSKK